MNEIWDESIRGIMFFIGFLKTVVTSSVSARAENQICEKAGCRYSYSICWNGCTVFDNEGASEIFYGNWLRERVSLRDTMWE